MCWSFSRHCKLNISFSLRNFLILKKFIYEHCKKIAESTNSKLEFILGDDLLKEKLNLIYNVGKGSAHKPALINLFY